MRCRGTSCRQGRSPCASPLRCSGALHETDADLREFRQAARAQQARANSAPAEPTEAQEAADRASAPVTAESAQTSFGDWFLAIAVGLMVASAFGAALFR